ncbi:hypothetical protein TRFO_25608 [Tritrichomonas foetus]|uniref:Phosphoprotein phosphatase n=1 Tax=Tritrichomonas foetus TaxID=1144522 RepID=A0A1J4K630_9EUKA|nr:hypothetical protein TRFO_25608 [Tritrichomonas foetus]|eukprot:OHT06336.1 hypothetical protein TRFO_25608 [Tritrichomonas foetus]
MRLASLRQKQPQARILHPRLSAEYIKPITKSTPQFPLSFNTQIRTLRRPIGKKKGKGFFDDGEIIPAREIEYTTPRSPFLFGEETENAEIQQVNPNKSDGQIFTIKPNVNHSKHHVTSNSSRNLLENNHHSNVKSGNKQSKNFTKTTQSQKSQNQVNSSKNIGLSHSNFLSEFNSNFLKMIDLCCKFCNFTDKNEDIQKKQSKSDTLDQINQTLENSENAKKLSHESVSSLFRMISLNIFRPIPVIHLLKNDVAKDTEWPHLQKVYKIFITSLSCTSIRPAILQSIVNSQLIQNLFTIFKTPDLREQKCISEVLTVIANRFVHTKKFLNQQCRNILLKSFNDESVRRALNYFFLFYLDFSQISRPPEYKKIFTNILLSLILLDNFEMFSDSYLEVILLFFSFDGNLIDIFLKYLIKHWPITNISKQKVFISYIKEIISFIEEFNHFIPQKTIFLMIRKFSCLFFDLTEDLSQISLSFINSGNFDRLISTDMEKYSTILYQAACEVNENHWINETKILAGETMQYLEKLNPELLKTMNSDLSKTEINLLSQKYCLNNSIIYDKKCIETWKAIIEIAKQMNFQNDCPNYFINFSFEEPFPAQSVEINTKLEVNV